MKKISIFSAALSRADVDSYEAVIDYLNCRGWQCQHVGLVPEIFQGVRKVALNAYRKKGHIVYGMNFKDDVKNSSKIIDLAEEIRQRYKPDIFLTDNERPSSVIIANYLQGKNIPVIRLDHGYFSEPSIVYKIFILKFIKHIYNIVKFLFIQKNKKLEKLSEKSYGNQIPGKICIYGGYNKRIYSMYGVAEKRLIETGSPYYDLVLKNKKICQYSNLPKKILIVSSGLGVIKKSDDEIRRFFRFVDVINTCLSKQYDIWVRLKPGEESDTLMQKFLKEKQFKLKIKFDNSIKERSYDSIKKFDLIMGDPSQVLHEAVMLDIPIILFKYSQFNYLNKFVDVLFKRPLDVIVLDNPAGITDVTEYAFSKEYMQKLKQNLSKAENYLFCHLDGKNSGRVADVILREIVSSKTKK